MTRQTFPDNTIWANAAPEIDPPDASLYALAYESGSGKTPPKAGVHNFLFNRADQMLQHIEQNGVPVWDARTIYALNGWCLGSDGMLYRSRQVGNVNHNPIGDDGTYWRSMTSISMEKMFPVGSAVMRPTNPGAAESAGGLGFGTWVDMQGRSPIGAGTFIDGNGDQKTFVEGVSTGEFNHRLLLSEIPSHDHANYVKRSVQNGSQYSSDANTNFDADDTSRRTGTTGGGQPHNNLHPVFAVKIWFRTA